MKSKDQIAEDAAAVIIHCWGEWLQEADNAVQFGEDNFDWIEFMTKHVSCVIEGAISESSKLH